MRKTLLMPTVVALHAFPLRSAMWQPQIDFLVERGHRVVAPDLAGFGTSDLPAGGASIDDYGDDVVAVLNELNEDRVVMLGLSMGGYVALSVAVRHPERLRGLVLADTRAQGDSPEVARRRTAQQQQLATEGTERLRTALVAGMVGATTSADKPELVQRVHDLADSPASAWIAALEALKLRPDRTAFLETICVPTLVVVGDEDRISPPAEVEQWQPMIADSTLVVLPRAGHLSNLEAAPEFNAALSSFLEHVR